jgi:AcrR family transcriptional regulator
VVRVRAGMVPFEVDAVKIGGLTLTLSRWSMLKRAEPYHKENLEAVLLATAGRLLAERGLEGLSLRELGREAGVSRSAPYHYFSDKAELLAKVGALGFARLGAAIQASVGGQADLDMQLRAGLRAYIQFALDEPAVFRLMFANVLRRDLTLAVVESAPPLEFSSNAAADAFGAFAHGVHAAQQRGEMAPGNPLVIVNTFWAFAHGVAELALGSNLKPAESMEEIFEAGISGLLASFRVRHG